MDECSDPDAKVLFRVSHDDDSDSANVETLWAWNLGDDRYKLDNLPYFAYSVSCGDIVYAPYDKVEGFPTFQQVLEKSGNRTIRVSFDPALEDGNDADKTIKGLVNLGCEYEGLNRGYIVLNIGPQADFEKISDFLINSEANFEYADPSYEELYGEEAV